MKNHSYAVWYSPVAKQDLKSIYTYIAYDLRERNTAKDQVNRIRREIRSLSAYGSCIYSLFLFY